MFTAKTRREFLSQVGKGMIVASVGLEAADYLGLAPAHAEEAPSPLVFGDREPLVRLMQETPINALLPALTAELKKGTPLRELTAAAALANARTFGGEDYVGFHTMMAIGPAYHMAQELPTDTQALPLLKVLYRNTNRIQEHGGRKGEVLLDVPVPAAGALAPDGPKLREAARNKNVAAAESLLKAAACSGPEAAFNDLLYMVHDDTEVHRVVMPYRAWDLLTVIGQDQAHTLLRQSIHYCVRAEAWSQTNAKSRELLPKLLDEHHLMDRAPGHRAMEDAWVDQMSRTLFNSTPQEAAAAAAVALAEGAAPDCLGEAITLCANQLVLRDLGRRPFEEVAGKPVGSVHGDSIGVHATDSANAWRNLARLSNHRNCFASLILGAYQVAFDRVNRGGDFLHWEPLPVSYHLQQIKATEADSLLRETEEAIRGNLQAHAVALVHRYGELGYAARPVFDLLLRYAISEDGALHGEKFYRTVTEEFNSTRPAYRWRHLLALTRVTASEFGRPAPGVAEARALLKA